MIQKRQAPGPGPGPNGEIGGLTTPNENVKIPKRTICISGDPAMPVLQIDPKSNLRLRYLKTDTDEVPPLANLPNPNLPWMPFLPTKDMWNEQQQLMVDQQKALDKLATDP